MACRVFVPLQWKLGPPGKSVKFSFWNRKLRSHNAPTPLSTQSNLSFYVIISGTKHFVEWKFCHILLQQRFGPCMGMGVCQELGPVKMVREDEGMDKMGAHRARLWGGGEAGVNLPFRLTDPLCLVISRCLSCGHSMQGYGKSPPSSPPPFRGKLIWIRRLVWMQRLVWIQRLI